MVRYLDTSVLVKLYVDEPDSEATRRAVDDSAVVATSVLAYPELRAAFARRQRERRLSRREHRRICEQLDRDWLAILTLPLTSHLALRAGVLAATHRLRGADAVHLAAFEQLVAAAEDDVEFLCADRALVTAAKRLGT